MKINEGPPARIEPAAIFLHNSRRLRKSASVVAIEAGNSHVGLDRVNIFGPAKFSENIMHVGVTNKLSQNVYVKPDSLVD